MSSEQKVVNIAQIPSLRNPMRCHSGACLQIPTHYSLASISTFGFWPQCLACSRHLTADRAEILWAAVWRLGDNLKSYFRNMVS